MWGRSLLLMFLLLSCFSANLHAEDGELAVGEIAPHLSVGRWLLNHNTAGSKINTRLVVIWAPWCPVSRLVLHHLDKLQQEKLSQGLQIIALTPELPSFTEKVVKEGKWKHLSIATDEDWTTFREYMGAVGVRAVPYAFLLRRNEDEGDFTLWWHGSVVSRQGKNALAKFDEILGQVVTGKYDFVGAIKEIRMNKKLEGMLSELNGAAKNADQEAVSELIRAITQLPLDEVQNNRVANKCNGIAWDIVSKEDIEKIEAEAGLHIAKLAMDKGGNKKAAVVDTYARALFETGDLAGAIKAQKRAVGLAKNDSSLAKTLARYERKQRGEAEPKDTKKAAVAKVEDTRGFWRGRVNDLWNGCKDEELLLITPSEFTSSADEKRWTTASKRLREGIFKKNSHMEAGKVDLKSRQEKTLVLYGTPATNSLIQETLDFHNIELAEDHLRVGDTTLRAENPIAILALANPWNTKLAVMIYTAFRECDSVGLNSFFHGPTSLVLGQWQGKKAKIITAINFAYKEGSDKKLQPSINTEGMAAGVLTAKQVSSDLEKLHINLHDNYGGYDDLQWKLWVRGSSWQKRLEDFKKRIHQKEKWLWLEVFDLFEEFIKDVQDTHFFMAGTSFHDGKMLTKRARFVETKVPFFTDLRLQKSAHGILVSTGPMELKECKGKPVKLRVVPGPYEVEIDRAYLFPTLSQKAGSQEYLVGVFKSNKKQMTTKVKIGAKEYELKLHRCKIGKGTNSGHPWKVSYPPDVLLPLLEVRTNNTKLIADVHKSAQKLREEQAVILDLRSNGGGGDVPAMNWAKAFSKQRYRWVSGAQLRRGQKNPLLRWSCWFGNELKQLGKEGPDRPYGGRLFVLTNRGIASSGETFTMLGSQVNGAIVVGESTSGCVGYGNCRREEALPFSRITLRYGHTKFVVDTIRHNPEGVGYFPDYWLDTDEPIAEISAFVKSQVN